MKKILTFFLAILTLTTPSIAHASTSIKSETVKIISYSLTKNEHVIESSVASGTLISSDGLILTNNHVVTDSEDHNYDAFSVCIVVDTNKRPICEYTASLVAKDKSMDIALIKINPKDIFGNNIPKLPYLDTKTSSLPKVNSKITLAGFPDVGGETITYTKGQISGYDEKENIKYIKSDAAISSGNSGGTAKDSSNRFIGVPSYVKSGYSTIGYIIPLVEIQSWLLENKNIPPSFDNFSNNLLVELNNLKYQSVDKNYYQSPIFPYFNIDIPKSWEVSFINDTSIILSRYINGEPLIFTINIGPISYDISQDLMDYIIEKIEENKRIFTNYSREDSSLKNLNGYTISFDNYNTRNVTFMAPIENVLFTYSYSVTLGNTESVEKEIDEIISKIDFDSNNNNTYKYQLEFQQENPDISIKSIDDFYISPIYDSKEKYKIVDINSPGKYEQDFSIYEEDLDKDMYELSISELLDEEIRYMNSTIINKYDNVIIDGLKGYAYTYTYKEDAVNKEHKHTEIVILNNKKYFRFIYDDLSSRYNEDIDDIISIIKNFSYNGSENVDMKGVYEIPSFLMSYNDVSNHLFEEEIISLSNKDILKYDDESYYPDKPMTRIKALDSIVKSKIHVEENKNSTETIGKLSNSSTDKQFYDINSEEYNQLLSYAKNEKIIRDTYRFQPYRGITLPEAIMIMCKVYDVKVWDPPYDVAWHLPYMYKGYHMGIIPIGAEQSQPLTKGQFAALLYGFVTSVDYGSEL